MDIDKPYGSWDEHGYLLKAMQLSRLIRDNAYSTEYACRVIEHADGMKQVEQPSKDLSMFSSPRRLGADRDWMTTDETNELSAMLHCFWSGSASLPKRVGSAIWWCEAGIHALAVDQILVLVFIAFEALFNTSKQYVTEQIATRVASVAGELGFADIDQRFVKTMYDKRSLVVHGNLLSQEVLADVDRLLTLLRATCRKAIEDTEFSGRFASEDTVKSFDQ